MRVVVSFKRKGKNWQDNAELKMYDTIIITILGLAEVIVTVITI